jgi:hypothetical protein
VRASGRRALVDEPPQIAILMNAAKFKGTLKDANRKCVPCFPRCRHHRLHSCAAI